MELPDFSGGAALPRRLPRIASFVAGLLALWCLLAPLPAFAEPASENRFDTIIYEVSQKYSMDPLLVKAVVWNESRFKPRATGSSGEIGLMQIRMVAVKDWAKERGQKVPSHEDVYDPYLNIEIGVWYLSRAMERWDGASQCYVLALCEYNAGRSNALKWQARSRNRGEIFIGSRTTRAYVGLVRDKYIEYSSMESNSFAGLARSQSPRQFQRD